MAVQKSRKSRSKRGMRRAHDSLTPLALTTDSRTGELHLRHHISEKGWYRGRLAIEKLSQQATEAEEA